MLYPTVDDLVKVKINGETIGNRYRLVNVTARLAREIGEEAMNEGRKLEDKPVKLAVLKLRAMLDEQTPETAAEADDAEDLEAEQKAE